MSILLASMCALAVQDTDRKDFLTVSARIVSIDGDFIDEENVDWGDVYKTGYGLGLQYAPVWMTPEGYGVGFYGNATADFLEGGSETISDPIFGSIEIEPEDMTLIRFTTGPRFRYERDELFFDAFAGAGVVWYPDVDVDLSGGGVSVGVEGVEETFTWALEVGGRVGISFSDSVEVGVGGSFELNGKADEADDFDGAGIGNQQNGTLTFSVSFKF